MARIILINSSCYLGSTSSSTVAVGTAGGTRTWALDPDQPLPLYGMTLRVQKAGDASVYVAGMVINDPTPAEPVVTVAVQSVAGSGTHSAWLITEGVLGFVRGAAYNHPSAPRFYDRSVKTIEASSEAVFQDGQTFGAATISGTAIVLINPNGQLDRLRTYGFFRRPTEMLVGDDAEDYSTFTPFRTGTVEQPVGDQGTMVLRFLSRLAELQKPVISDRFQGTNSGPDGVEGEDDIKGRFKALLRGYPGWNLSLILVNGPRRVYLISARQIHGVAWVRDGGLPLTLGRVCTSLADLMGVTKTFTGAAGTAITCAGHGYPTGTPVSVMTTGVLPAGLVQWSVYFVRSTGADTLTLHQTAADAAANASPVTMTTAGTGAHSIWSMPAPQTYDVYLGNDATGEGAYVRLGSMPQKVVTCDAWEGATTADRYAGAIFRRTMVKDAGYTDADLNLDDLAALDEAAPYEQGFWAVGGGNEEDLAQPKAPDLWGAVEGSVSVKAALDVLCPGALMWYSTGPSGIFRCGQITADLEEEEPVAVFRREGSLATGEFKISDFDIVETNDASRGLPVCRVVVKSHPNFTPQGDADLNGDKDSPSGDPIGGLAVRETLKRRYKLQAYPATQDEGVVTKWARLEREFVTALRHAADAAVVAQKFFAIFSVLRNRTRIEAPIQEGMVDATRLGAVNRLVAPRHGYDNGKNDRVLGTRYDLDANVIILDCWGSRA